MTKDWLIAALLRIYPAAWRREYGAELTSILLDRPLDPRVAADLIWNGLWQRGRSAEPSTVLGFASLLIIMAGLASSGGRDGLDGTRVLQSTAMTFPTVTVTLLASDFYALLLIACGWWTYVRHGGSASRSGVAAMRVSLIAGMPIIAGALLMMSGLVHVRVPAGPLHAPSAWAILVAPLARLPGSWMWGAIGGVFGKWIARRQPRAAATS